MFAKPLPDFESKNTVTTEERGAGPHFFLWDKQNCQTNDDINSVQNKITSCRIE